MAPSPARPPPALFRWYEKLAAFKVEDLFSRKKLPGPQRTVYVNEDLPRHCFDHRGRVKKEHVYSTNQVITSKYTIITFVPRNLLEQFRRIANIFFLGIAILQFFNKFSTISPGLVLLPLIIVLSITAAKDAYEDVKRHQSDRWVNHSLVRVLAGGSWVNPNVTGRKSRTFVRGIVRKTGKSSRVKNSADGAGSKEAVDPQVEDTGVEYDDHGPQQQQSRREEDQRSDVSQPHHLHLFGHHDSSRPHWKKTGWEDVRVGDFVKIMDNEPIPADVLICSTSEDENVAYVETKNLDGETNLKSRHAVAPLTHIRSAADCISPQNTFRIDCDRPDTNMYRLNATVRVDKDVVPVDMQMILLRGTVLRNTGWVIGIVLYTGEDTRIVMNAGGTPSKRSKVERQMNPQVFLNLMLLAIMAIICGVLDSVLQRHYYHTGALWLWGANRPGDNPSINGLITFAFALITFQNIVPISLYISIEFVRTCQAAFIYFDSEMYYEKTGQPTLARSWNLSDDLGQIEYIFSDKTGTLTQNSMVFRKCTIGGKVYNGESDEEYTEEKKEDPPTILKDADIFKEAELFSKNFSRKPQRPRTEDIPLSDIRSSGSSTAVQQLSPREQSSPPLHPSPPAPGSIGSGAPGGLESSSVQSAKHFYDADLARDLRLAVHTEPESSNAAHARHLNGFFTVLALCHTVLTSTNPETGAIEYKAQSPDEAALVQAAADMGFVFRGRDREVLMLQTPFSVDEYGEEVIERYELLNVLEFTSTRKRMSVVLKKIDSDDERIFLLTKGADNVIFERLKKGTGEEAEELRRTTEGHLDEFAGQGLRTLTLAYKVIASEEYEAWNEKYHQASISLDDRDEKIEAVSSEIEQDLRLLGATAIEDKLQDGVPETIADLKKAGIKVWVATGDKLETAIAIGHSTNLIGGDSNIIVIRGGANSAKTVWNQLAHAVQEFFPESGILDDQGVLAETSKTSKYGVPSSGRQSVASVQGGAADRPYLRRADTGLASIVGDNNGDRPGGFILVVDGAALDVAFGDEEHKTLLLRLSTMCEGVICCRASPLQKALVVKLVKDGLCAMTLAIGDGANDVSMIQAADVGVGISGEEGLQAVNSSDYAIAQFRFLKRLLLVHGHWSYARNGNMILNFFYKNIVCIGVLWWFQIYCGWSSNYVFEYTYLLFWNSFWTIAPVIAIGIFDRFIDSSVLMELPQLYEYGRKGTWFGLRQFVIYMFDGIVQSAIIYFFILYTYFTPSARTDGFTVSLYEFSTTMAFGAVFAANFFNGLETSAWTAWVFFAVIIGGAVMWVYTAIYNAIAPNSWYTSLVYGNNHFLFESAYYWLSFFFVVILALAPRYLAKFFKFTYLPNDLDVIRFIHKKDPHHDFAKDIAMHPPFSGYIPRPPSALSQTRMDSVTSLPRPSMDWRNASRTDMSTGARSVYRGFDFSTEENGVAMRRLQSNLSERRASSRNVDVLPAESTPKKKRSNVLSVGKTFLRKKVSSKNRNPKEQSKDED
ncbi:phospholipid-translocating P-type ATPase [Macrolepiota fuliginosa MF-IS2]|uniref:Phospholipid-transporting ATPase n=1 Tax=Macrolepiota fuliginosa MF-IS2 TaxID=1400762 RepID=A0A9P6C312_9AGAR|nr:phospholipid-translocating P-type ATPase [Macrolepiota fuliginosa MF-IS2]